MIERQLSADTSADSGAAELWDPLDALPRFRWWLWGVLALFISVTFGPAFLTAILPDRESLVDFYQDWASAKNYLRGVPVYEDHLVTIPDYLGYAAHLDFTVNAHPPTSVLFFIPFALLDYPAALLAWRLVSLLALAASLVIIKGELGLRMSPFAWLPLLVMTLTCGPLLQTIHQGQFNAILLLLLVFVWKALRRGQPTIAGTVLGVASAIKLFPAFVFVYLAARRQWGAMGSGLSSFACVTLIALATFGSATFEVYADRVLPRIAGYKSLWPNASVAGFWHKLFDPSDEEISVVGGGERQIHLQPAQPLLRAPRLAALGTLASRVLVITLCAAVAYLSRSRPGRDLSYCVCLIAMLLVSPIAWDHYLLLMLLPLAVLWLHLPKSALVRGAMLLIVCIFWTPAGLFYVTFVPDGGAGWVHVLTVLSLQFYALLGLFLIAVGLGMRAERKPSPGPDGPTSPARGRGDS